MFAHFFLCPSVILPPDFARFFSFSQRNPLTRFVEGTRERSYTSTGGRIPGRRDACTDCVELVASSSESRERRRDVRRDGTLDSHSAGPQARRTIRCCFSSFHPLPHPTSLSAPQLISFSLPLYLFISFFSLSRSPHSLVCVVGYNIQFIMYL